ncbi:hypothetical protein DPMN_184243 [Dreissena polymorpha]|uniref:Uncharacterized protein n=1 Tax=Dreissena polymorpha TaxID=45954 RepID=A0A9D4DIV7_DREPO|nr:hypothetical protein DPMN_184243 [Dreissena polymorpha]
MKNWIKSGLFYRECSHVVIIADKVKDLNQKGEFIHLSASLSSLHRQLIQKKDDFEKSMQSLDESSYKIIDEIHALRKAINDLLDQLETNTIKELDTLLARLRASIQTDTENCTISIQKMTRVQDDWLNAKDKSEAVNLIMYRKCLDQSLKTKEVLKGMTVKNDMILTFNPDTTIQKTLSSLSGLGQILCQMNTGTRQNRPKASGTIYSQFYHGHQTSGSNKPDVDSNPGLNTLRQADIANQTTRQNKTGLVHNPLPIFSTTQSSTGNFIGDQNKPRLVSNQWSSPYTQSSTRNLIGDQNKPSLVSNQWSRPYTQYSNRNLIGDQNKARLVSDPLTIPYTQSSTRNLIGDQNKAGLVSDPLTIPSTQSSTRNLIGDQNKPGLVSNPLAISSIQPSTRNLIGDQNKAGLVFNPLAVRSTQSSTGNLIGDQNKAGLVSNPFSSFSTQSSTGNLIGDQNKTGLVSNPLTVRSTQSSNRNFIGDQNKAGQVSDPVSSFSTHSVNGNLIGDQNKPGLVSDPFSSFSIQSSNGNFIGE